MAKRYDIGEQRRQRESDSRREAGRGREAETPRQIPKPGWRDTLLRTKAEMNQDNLSLVAAGIAFYGLLAIFPAIAAAISLYGLVADPATVEQQMSSLMGVMPQEAAGILREQLRSLASQPSAGLSAGLIGGLLLTLWSSAKGTKALMQGLNIVYDEDERRGFFRLNGTAFLLTAGGIVFGLVALALVAVLPALLGLLPLPDWLRATVSLVRWPVLLGVVLVALAAAYRYGPSRRLAKWTWVSWGAVAATVLWLVASIGFSVYVSNFGSYGKTYGSVGAVVILMMWFYLTAYVALLGAELNAELEHQTRRDTTRGPAKPMGRRDAEMADTVGRSP